MERKKEIADLKKQVVELLAKVERFEAENAAFRKTSRNLSKTLPVKDVKAGWVLPADFEPITKES